MVNYRSELSTSVAAPPSWDCNGSATVALVSVEAAAEVVTWAADWADEGPGLDVDSLGVEVGAGARAASASGGLLSIESKPGPSVGSKPHLEAEVSSPAVWSRAADDLPGNTRRRRRTSSATTTRSTSRLTPTSTSTTSNVSDFS